MATLDPLRAALDSLESTAKQVLARVETAAETVTQDEVDQIVQRVKIVESRLSGSSPDGPSSSSSSSPSASPSTETPTPTPPPTTPARADQPPWAPTG